jgi:glutathione reductase (NADPH)
MSGPYDLFVIGAGSGGVRAARVAARAGARVAIAEEFRIGGTCVIRGCVPKKLLVYASEYSSAFKDAAGYGWTVEGARFDWDVLRANVAAEVERLSGIYARNLEASGVEIIRDRAEIAGPGAVRLSGSGGVVEARRILVAVGGFRVRSMRSPRTRLSFWNGSRGASSSPAGATSPPNSPPSFTASAPRRRSSIAATRS